MTNNLKRICIICIGLIFLSNVMNWKTDRSFDLNENLEEREEQITDENVKKSEEQRLYPKDQKSCIIQEDESSIYICGIYKIVKFNKETMESIALWESQEIPDEQEMYLFSEGSGLLAGDKIYFIEGWAEGAGNGFMRKTALSVIHTDGTGYERIMQPEKLYGSASMLLQDGMLYVDAGKEILSCKVCENGDFFETIAREKKSERDGFPEGYEEPEYYDNGYRLLFASESMKKFEGVILEKQLNLVKWIPETGEIFNLSQFSSDLKAYNGRYFLISAYDMGNWLIDTVTLEERKFTDGTMNVIAMDDNYIYTESETYEDGQIWQIYEKISLETAQRSIILKKEENRTAYSWYGNDLLDAVVRDGYLYYAGELDYKLYLMRRKVDEPAAEECLGEAFYDSGINEVGAMETCHERFEAPGVRVNIDLEWLQIDGRFPGADKINEYLTKDQEQHYAYEKQLFEEHRKTEDGGNEAVGDEITLHFGCSSEFAEISCFDGRYLSFCQSGIFDESGVHGKLEQTGYTFDLQTGERLVLSDIIANSEDELKDIVTKYFGEVILSHPEYYLENALDTVRERTDFHSSFYLTKEGIRFYFEPYALASFAAGF